MDLQNNKRFLIILGTIIALGLLIIGILLGKNVGPSSSPTVRSVETSDNTEANDPEINNIAVELGAEYVSITNTNPSKSFTGDVIYTFRDKTGEKLLDIENKVVNLKPTGTLTGLPAYEQLPTNDAGVKYKFDEINFTYKISNYSFSEEESSVETNVVPKVTFIRDVVTSSDWFKDLTYDNFKQRVEAGELPGVPLIIGRTFHDLKQYYREPFLNLTAYRGEVFVNTEHAYYGFYEFEELADGGAQVSDSTRIGYISIEKSEVSSSDFKNYLGEPQDYQDNSQIGEEIMHYNFEPYVLSVIIHDKKAKIILSKSAYDY